MKKLLFLLFGLFVLAGCKKSNEEPKPKTAAETVAGNYTLISFSSTATNGLTVPLPFTYNGTTISGTATATAVVGQDAQIDVKATIKQSGAADVVTEYKGVQLQTAASGYTLVYQGANVGTADGTTLTVSQGGATVTAKK